MCHKCREEEVKILTGVGKSFEVTDEMVRKLNSSMKTMTAYMERCGVEWSGTSQRELKPDPATTIRALGIETSGDPNDYIRWMGIVNSLPDTDPAKPSLAQLILRVKALETVIGNLQAGVKPSGTVDISKVKTRKDMDGVLDEQMLAMVPTDGKEH